MKKIMFNDKYGLTEAVLAKRKTQTRRIADTIHLNDVTCVEQRKNDDGSFSYFLRNGQYGTSKYKIGEEIAVAQPYKEVCGYLIDHKGYNNKMFVAAGLMPHRIRITNIRVERLQDISDEDCLAEGIVDFESRINKAHFYSITDESATYGTAKKTYSLLIDKICGKGTWKSNPYVFVYEFELIK